MELSGLGSLCGRRSFSSARKVGGEPLAPKPPNFSRARKGTPTTQAIGWAVHGKLAFPDRRSFSADWLLTSTSSRGSGTD